MISKTRYIDFRSDTVTQPTQEMRDAMYTAPVGDDVFEDDPSINELEALAAQILGKEAALFVTSGTQGNGLCVMTHTRRGDSIIVAKGCHIVDHEAGAYAVLSGVSPCYVRSQNGAMDIDHLQELIIDDSELQIARTGLVCIENAFSTGTVVPLENMQQVYQVAHQQGVPVHLDGARLFNAALALGVDVQELTKCCDTVMCCLSKGLCAPVGSIIAGSREFIKKARKNRKLLGGGMRQAGFLAAAGKIAITEMPKRLYIDHENAMYLAEELQKIPGILLDISRVQIDMVFFDTDWSIEKKKAYPHFMLEQGFKVTGYEGGEFRLVSNKDTSREDCKKLIENIKKYAQK